MRGFILFINDLRKCKGKDEELKRINEELANIRSKFKGDKHLDGYQKRKYICKLVFIFLLGHKFEFGLKEAINLLSSNAYNEKQAGYLFISVVKGEDYNLKPLVINALKDDLSSSNHIFQNLALQFIANSVHGNMVDSLFEPVTNVLLSGIASDFVKQSAVLTLLQLLRIKPDLVVTEVEVIRLINLISHPNTGLATASVSLIAFLIKKFPSQCESCVSQCTMRLSKIVTCCCTDLRNYNYYRVSAPWLTVKLLRILQQFPASSYVSVKGRLKDALEIILRNPYVKIREREHNNIKFAIIFEAISLIINMEFEDHLISRAFVILEGTLKSKDVNFKCMTLEIMTRLSNNRMYLERVKSEWHSILNFLKYESNSSIKKLAVDLLYTICCVQNVKLIVDEMLRFLECEHHYTEDIMSQIAALAERFGNDREWYFDTIFNLFHICGDKMSDSIWHSLVRTVMQNDNIQEYAAKKSYSALCEKDCHDTVIKMSGYILGEFGYLIGNDPRNNYRGQFNVLKKKYNKCSPSTKALLLTTFMKFHDIYPDLKHEIQLLFKANIRSVNEEIQQRAVEYLKLSQIASNNFLATLAFEEMPTSIRKESDIMKITENFSVNRIGNRRKEKSLTRRNSQYNLKSVSENFNEVQIHKAKSASHVDFQHFSSSDNRNLLVDIDRDSPSSNVVRNTLPAAYTPSASTISNVLSNESFLHNMLFNEKAMLYENDIIAISIESEFRKHFGRFHLQYTNTSDSEFSRLSVLGNFANIENKCSVWFKPSNSMLLAKETMEQDIHIECLKEFSERPSLNLKFFSKKQYNEIKLILPLTLNKFVEPSQMTLEAFTKRWKNFEILGQEVAKKFTAKYPMIYRETWRKLKDFRLFIIESMESESESFHCSGIFYSRDNGIGLLVCLERDVIKNQYSCRIRSNQLSLSHIISNLLLQLL